MQSHEPWAFIFEGDRQALDCGARSFENPQAPRGYGPSQLRLGLNPIGKHFVAFPSLGPALKFDHSHCGGFVLYAFCIGQADRN
jgi:hypothetical protein